VKVSSSRHHRQTIQAALRRSLKLCTAEGLVGTPLVAISLPVNVFLSALFTKALHLPLPTIGVIASLPFLCNFLQVFVAPWLSRHLSPKAHVWIPVSVHATSWLAFIVILEFLPRNDPVIVGRWLAGWYFVSSFAASLAGVGWNAWIQGWVPARLRGKYFGQRNQLLSVATLTFLAVTGWSLAHWDYSIRVFQVIILFSASLRFVSVAWIWRTPAANLAAHAQTAAMPLREQLARVRHSKSLLAFVSFGAVWSFAANCYGPFYPVFMFEELKLTAFDVGTLFTLSTLGGAASLPAWGKLLDRYGNKAVMTVSLLLWQAGNVSWCFLTPERSSLLYGVYIWSGMTGAGFILGQFTLLLKLIPVAAKNLAIGVYLSVTSLVAAVAPIIGGLSLNWALSRWDDSTLHVYHVCFIVQPVVACIGAFWLLRVHEPSASSLTNVMGAMRNIRTLSGIFGLSFLVNYVFYRPQRR
jgi:MFS family permease